MANEYIEKEAFISRYRELHCKDCDHRKGMKNGKMRFVYGIGEAPCRACWIEDMIDCVDDWPAADVRENVRGEWVQHYETTSDNETLPYGWECSLCGRWELEKQPFCNCGAEMGGAEDGSV